MLKSAAIVKSRRSLVVPQIRRESLELLLILSICCDLSVLPYGSESYTA